MKCVLCIDQGTTGSRAVLYDSTGTAFRIAYREFTQIFPQPSWVEHDPSEIWETVLSTIGEVLNGFDGTIVAIGITNQRETTILWDKTTGRPLHNAIVWQCRRTAGLCEKYRPHQDMIREKTGLPLDAYFSATKIRWLLDTLKPSNTDNIAFGTIDSWLVWNLTGGKRHVTDVTNASRTLLYNIHTRDWDDELLALFDIPRQMLPEVLESAADFGDVTKIGALTGVPVHGVAGDQQSALFGQGCFTPGTTKNTYGTGCFMVMNTGNDPISDQSLVTTLAVSGDGSPCYALEGSIFIAGAAVQWLRDELGIIQSAAETESIARSIPDNGGVYLVPAFSGLGAPYWDMEARGIITGLTRGTGKAHIVRAALESMALQTLDVLDAMERASNKRIERLMVDGGAVANDFLMQFQADIIDRPVVRPVSKESTALGAAMIAGLGAGFWHSSAELAGLNGVEKIFYPAMDDDQRERIVSGWRTAVEQARYRKSNIAK